MINIEQWLNWWRNGFVTDIDKSWSGLPWFQLGVEEQRILYQDAPSAVRALCQITSDKLTQPDDRILSFIDLSPMRQKAMMRLFSALCNEDFSFLTGPDRTWCLRMVKAIRPQSFLPSGIDYNEPHYLLSLFQQVFAPPVWSRLRLRFNQADILRAEMEGLSDTGISRKRLWALMDASLWRMEKR